MEALLSWQGLVFHIPLLAGVLLALGGAWGGTGDADGDTLVDGGHALEAGRVPFSLVLMVGLLTFGGVGVVLRAALGGLPDAMAFPLSVLGAAVGCGLLTRTAARWLGRVLPSVETYRVSRDGLVGRVGVLVLPASPRGGLCQVRDHEGNLHQVRVHTREEELCRSVEVVLLEHHPADNTFTVAALEEHTPR